MIFWFYQEVSASRSHYFSTLVFNYYFYLFLFYWFLDYLISSWLFPTKSNFASALPFGLVIYHHWAVFACIICLFLNTCPHTCTHAHTHTHAQILVSLFDIFQWQRKRCDNFVFPLALPRCSYLALTLATAFLSIYLARFDLRFIVIAAFMIDYWLELYDTHARMRACHTKKIETPANWLALAGRGASLELWVRLLRFFPVRNLWNFTSCPVLFLSCHAFYRSDGVNL